MPSPTNGPRSRTRSPSATYPGSIGLPARSTPSGAITWRHGVYGSYNVGANDTCTMLPGLYVFTGTVSLQATNSTLLGTGVTLLLTCKAGSTAEPSTLRGSRRHLRRQARPSAIIDHGHGHHDGDGAALIPVTPRPARRPRLLAQTHVVNLSWRS